MTSLASGSTVTMRYDSTTSEIGPLSSSIRYKTDVRSITDVINVSSVIDNLRPVNFKYKASNANAYGLIAEEVYPIIPEIVPIDKDGIPMSVSYEDIVPFLIAELQKTRSRLATSEKCIDELYKLVSQQQLQISQLLATMQ